MSPSQKAIYFGDPKTASLHKIKFNSCYDLPYQGSVKLPEKLKPLTNIFVDEDERLFVTTLAPDDYNNASLFFWNKSEWIF